jgi:hypothetical protein
MRWLLLIFSMGFLLMLVNCQSKTAENTSTTADEITFADHIGPIIYKNCTPCHNRQGVGPFPFENYQDIAHRANMIAKVTAMGFMPPWKADRSFSHFYGERFLAEEEIALIQRWVAEGAKAGALDKIQAPQNIAMNTDFGREPDLVVQMQETYTRKPNDIDVEISFSLEIPIASEKDPVAVRFVPGNPKIIHHAWLALDTTGYSRILDSLDPGYGFIEGNDMIRGLGPVICGYVPGEQLFKFPEGIGFHIKPGNLLAIQVHYVGGATEQIDQSSVELYFADEPIERQVKFFIMHEIHMQDGPLFIAAEDTGSFHSSYELPIDMSVIGVVPHMHYRGKKFKAVAQLPDGSLRNLISIRDWDFNWQVYYRFPKLVHLPAGTRIKTWGSYDNRSSNFANPIVPPIDIGYGYKSTDEMFQFVMFFTDYQEGDEERLLDYGPASSEIASN